MHVHVRAKASSAGGDANEDAAGAAGRFAWIVDGASGVSARTLAEDATDAAWLAGTIDRVLQERIAASADQTMEALLGDLQDALGRGYEDALAVAPDKDSDGPSACLGLVELRATRESRVAVRGAVVGDVCIFVPGSTGLERWSDERLKPFEARTLEALRRAGRSPAGTAEAVLEQIRRNRTSLNREGGYFAVHPRLPWTESMLAFETTIRAGAAVVLATDGFLRLCDLFAAMSDRELYAGAAAGEAKRLLDLLRHLERNDPEGRRFARVKIHDDATVLIVAADLSLLRADGSESGAARS